MNPTQAPKPIVLVPACNKHLGEHPFHVVGRKYTLSIILPINILGTILYKNMVLTVRKFQMI